MSRHWSFPVVLASLLLSPWPILALGVRPAPQRELVAIPVRGPELAAPVSPVFSRAPYFLIVDLRDGAVRALANPYLKAAHAAGVRCAHLLLRERVGVALVDRVGPEPFNNLSARGVVIHGGAQGRASDALAAYASGALPLLTHPTAPLHYGLERTTGAPAAAPAVPTAGIRRL